MVKDFQKREKLAAAQQWLDGWGMVVYERQVTGDPSAVPKVEFGCDGPRGKPGQLAGVWEVYMSVESLLQEWQGDRIRLALELAHIKCVEQVVTMVTYELPDGSLTELDHRETPPAVYVSATPRTATIRKRPDWRRLAIARDSEQFLREHGLTKYQFWAYAYKQFQWALIDCRIFGKMSVREWRREDF